VHPDLSGNWRTYFRLVPPLDLIGLQIRAVRIGRGAVFLVPLAISLVKNTGGDQNMGLTNILLKNCVLSGLTELNPPRLVVVTAYIYIIALDRPPPY